MHEKTLLYSALTATALAAAFGVYKAHDGASTPVAITPVSLIDANRAVSQAEVPIRLTSSDGTGLRLESLRAEASVEDPLALTELHLVFENPEDRILEGTFRITLPQGASLSRFAMKVGSVWQEGEVVEKQAARQAYEDFLHRRQDPALMEQSGGNEFSARVFPIPARGRKEIVISYSEVLEAGAPYVLPLRGLPMLGALDVNVHASGGRTDASFGLHQQRFTPGQDFVVEGKQLPRSAGLRSGELAIARIVPFATSRPERVDSAVVLVDTSASRGLGLTEQTRLVQKVLANLPGDALVSVACFDQDVLPIYEGKASGFGDKEAAAILARGALGASDFEQAIGWAAETAKREKAKRVILVGDGVATAGETDAQKLKDKVQALRDAGVERMDAIAVGGIRDDAFLRTIVRGVLDKDGVVLDGKLGPDALARRLGEATSSGVPVKIEGARWSWPDKLDGLQAGDEVMVYAEVDAAQPIKIAVGTQQFAPDLKSVERPLVERAWAKAKIQALIEAPTEDATTTKRRIVELSTRHRVLSPHTALLVLETDWDYRRFGIDRNATVDILTVESGRVAVMRSSRDWSEQQAKNDRAEKAKGGAREQKTEMPSAPLATATAAAAAPAAAPPGLAELAGPQGHVAPAAPGSPPPAEPMADAFETGGLGLSGIGEGGGGAANGRGTGTGLGAIGGAAGGHAAAGGAGNAPAPAAPRAMARPAPRPSMPGQVLRENDDDRPGRITGPTPAPTTVDNGVTGQVRPGTLVVQGGIAEGEVQRVTRGATPRLRACYTRSLALDPTLHGRVEVRVVVDSLGQVKTADAAQSPSPALGACVSQTFRTLTFPAPGTGDARFTASFDFVTVGGDTSGAEIARPSPPSVPKALPYEGRLKIVMEDLSRGEKEAALSEAKRWQTDQPGDMMALVALGEAYEAKGDTKTAARAYGSILELFSFRADSRRFAGERLERLADPGAIKLAIDTYKKAVEQRPDHPASHRLYAFTLVKHGEYAKAFEAIKKGSQRSYPVDRFRGVDRILKEDMGLVAAAWAKAEPARRAEIMQKLHEGGGTEENDPSLRFVLVWETDANDVDFHIHDGKGGHAYYGQKELASGGELYADVTTGYGPECFTIRAAKEKRAYPYTLQAHYYSRGPMGYGMGKLEIIDHDGKGGLTFEERPFVVMVDRAYVDMGTITRNKPEVAALAK